MTFRHGVLDASEVLIWIFRKVEYKYGCYDDDFTDCLLLSDFEIKKYQDSFDKDKERHTLVLHFCK